MKTTFIAFDFETTGFSPKAAEIVEIGAVKFDAQGKVLGTFEQLVKPSLGINPDAQAVNGISEAMVAHCPSIAEVMPQFMLFIGAPEQNILIAHNASKFDIGFLAMGCARSGLPMPDHRIVDSIDLCRQCMPKPYNLRSVCQRLGIATGAHRALGDAMAVMRVVLRLGSRHPGAWQNLPFYYAEDFGVEIIDPPAEFEEWEACCDPTQEVEIVYAGGSRPEELRIVIPKGFFEYKGREFMTAFCLLDGIDKTFDVSKILSVELPEEASGLRKHKVKKGLSELTPETMEQLSRFKAAFESMNLGGAPSNPTVPAENKPPPKDSLDTAFNLVLGVVMLAIVIGFFALMGYAAEKIGDDGVFILLAVAGVVGFVIISVVNTMNGFIDSIFGPRR